MLPKIRNARYLIKHELVGLIITRFEFECIKLNDIVYLTVISLLSAADFICAATALDFKYVIVW